MNNQPAIFAPIKKVWLEEAVKYFKGGNEFLYFYTDSYGIVNAENLEVKNIYFKAKGENFISAVAEFVDMVTENPKEYRLPNSIEVKGKYYYGFKNIKILEIKIPMNKITRYLSNLTLRNDTPGLCIINEPIVK